MGNALKKCGRPIVFAICEWGPRKPWLWARAAGGHLWRTTWDSRDVWQSNHNGLTGIMEIFDQQEALAPYSGPGGWNDPDLLMVGLYGKGGSSSVNGRFKGCTSTEYRTHFALWCMLDAPLIVNLDLKKIDTASLQLITNKELIQINQDTLGKQAVTVYRNNDIQVLQKTLSNNRIAICVFNRGASSQTFTLDLKKDLNLWQPLTSANIFSGNIQTKSDILKGNLASHDCAVYILSPGKK
jgi:alpha-galactosidase